MNSLSMILRILAIVAALAAGGIFYVSKGKLAEQQTATQQAEKAIETVKTERDKALEQLDTLKGELKTERGALTDSKRNLESARSEMYTAKQEVSRAQQQLNDSKKNISELDNTAKRLRADLLTAEQGLAAVNKEGEIAQLNERVKELENANADLKESLDSAKSMATTRATAQSSVSNNGSLTTGGAYRSTFTPTQSQPLPTASLGAETTIQTVSAENGLIALANNAALGLTPGVEVTVIADRKALGKIQIVKITDEVVVANILPGAKTRSMVKGSTVNLLR